MENHHIFINEVPAILWGQRSKRLFLYIHGKGGSKEEAAAISEIVCQRGFQVLRQHRTKIVRVLRSKFS